MLEALQKGRIQNDPIEMDPRSLMDK
jgi:hypothetical protein